MVHTPEDEVTEIPQLAVFDIDGTITHPHATSIPDGVLDGFKHLKSKDAITTICTGRPYVRMKEVLGKNFDTIIDDDALIAVEHGAKIVDKWGKVVMESEFTDADIDKLIEFTGLNIDIVQFLAFNPADPAKRPKYGARSLMTSKRCAKNANGTPKYRPDHLSMFATRFTRSRSAM